MSAPVLLLKGGRDEHSPAEAARERIVSALGRGGNQDVEFVLFPDADHLILEWPMGRRIPPPVFADGYIMTMIQWLGSRLEMDERQTISW